MGQISALFLGLILGAFGGFWYGILGRRWIFRSERKGQDVQPTVRRMAGQIEE